LASVRTKVLLTAGALIMGLAVLPRRAAAAPVTLGPGDMLTLDQDMVLGPGDAFMADGAPDNPCMIEGQGHTLSTDPAYSATFLMRNCNVHGLGSVTTPGLVVIPNGTADVTLDGNTFDASGEIHVNMMGTGGVQILRNTVLETSVIDVMMTSGDNAIPAMLFDGSVNATAKVFQGNRIFRGTIIFDHTQNWLIGGMNPGEGNVIIGDRGAIFTNLSSVMHIVGNYVRNPGNLYGWNQVKPLVIQGNQMLIEHNVIRDGNWLVDVAGADVEIRYNLLGDSHDRPWLILEDSDGSQKVHHNVFIRNDPGYIVDGVWVRHPDTDTASSGGEIYNNTFYGGGDCWTKSGPGVVVEPGSFLASLRSNALVGIVTQIGADTAIVRGGGPDRNPAPGEPLYEPKNPPLVRLGYTDYNLFYNPKAAVRDNYALAVAGKRERLDAGFALHDALSGGNVDDQVDPKFADKIPVTFPYSDDDIKAGNTTVCQILRFYRGIFSPGTGSPLVGAGDPADGTGNNIGAIGGPPDQDLFGTLCASDDVGTPSLGSSAYVCPMIMPTGTGGSTGGTGVAPGGKGFVCVCAEGAGGPSAPTAMLALAIVVFVVRVRAARRRPPRRLPGA